MAVRRATPGDVDSVRGRIIKDHVRTHDKCAKVLGEVTTPFAKIGFVGEPFEHVEDFVEQPVRGRRVVFADVIADGVERSKSAR